jgi:CheY-like chemotaxis protein
LKLVLCGPWLAPALGALPSKSPSHLLHSPFHLDDLASRSITVSQTAFTVYPSGPPLARVLIANLAFPAWSLLSLDSAMNASALRILAVDNEPSVTFSLSYIFNGPRYELSAVENGDAALARLDAGSQLYDVIIVDQKMPHMTGVELVGEIKKRGVTSRIMVLSAHISSEVRAAYERMDVHFMFPKPFDIGQLRSAVDQLAA